MEGYQVCFMGDFKARITPDQRFDFVSYPHKSNNNGALLNSFADTNNLYCLNPMVWNGVAKEKPTYQRNMGMSTHISLIDYILVTPNFCHSVFEARVIDDIDHSVNLDHSMLYLTFFGQCSTYLLKILWAMTAWLFLGHIWDPHTPYFSPKTSFLCHNFTSGCSGRCLELVKRCLGLRGKTARLLGCPGIRGYVVQPPQRIQSRGILCE